MADVTSMGSYLQWRTGAGPAYTFVTLALIRTIAPKDSSSAILDRTNLLSPGGRKQKRPGSVDPGNVTFEGLFDPNDTTQDAENGILSKQGKMEVYRIVYNDDEDDENKTTQTFNGFVSALSIGNIAVDELATISGTITVDGEEIWDKGV